MHTGKIPSQGGNQGNECNLNLAANTASAEYTGSDGTNRACDMLANGFKLKGTDTDTNYSGRTYAYIAFAASPFVSSNSIPGTAR